jgi:5-methylcytosine-specific restriction endonuclease McrA
MKRSGFAQKQRKPMKRTAFTVKHPPTRSKLPLGASQTTKTIKGTTKPKKAKKSTLKKELDRVFSIYIRKRDNGQCFTCPKQDDYKNMQNGHFVPRQYLAVRWDEKNCNCQCYACNMLYGGQGATYAIRLKQKYGQEIVEWLESQRWVTTKLDDAWYREKIAYYKALI